jgi:hypothetical protein
MTRWSSGFLRVILAFVVVLLAGVASVSVQPFILKALASLESHLL